MPDDDILDISLDDLADEPLPPVAPDSAPVLDVSLDDLADEPTDVAAFPALTADQLTAADSSLTIRTLCSATGRPYLIRYVEDKPGLFVTHEVTVDQPDSASVQCTSGFQPRDGSAATVTGTFGTSKDYQCPFCGSRAILVCSHCGTDLCAGPGDTGRCTCPNCKTQIQAGGKATSATGIFGGKGKGKKA